MPLGARMRDRLSGRLGEDGLSGLCRRVDQAWEGKFNLSLNPRGSNVPNCFIQKSSLLNRAVRICSLVIVLWFSSSSMTIILKSAKVWPASWKCLSILMGFSFFASFRCLLMRRFACWVSILPTYCRPSLHLSHHAWYMAFLLRQPVFCRTSNLFRPDPSVNTLVFTMWVQHRASALPRHGVHLPDFLVVRTILPPDSLVCPRTSLRFLFRL